VKIRETLREKNLSREKELGLQHGGFIGPKKGRRRDDGGIRRTITSKEGGEGANKVMKGRRGKKIKGKQKRNRKWPRWGHTHEQNQRKKHKGEGGKLKSL